MMLIQHAHCPDLLKRILPSCLIMKFRSMDRYDNAMNWQRFFQSQFYSNLDNAREQWGDKMRNELARKLAEEMR